MAGRGRRERIVRPGPAEQDVLRLQTRHISQHVWNGEVDRTLETRRCTFGHVHNGNPPEEVIPYLIQAGFYGVSRLVPFEFECGLVSALIERWRPETHTFHMPHGECTITLQDVAIQLGLPCDGAPLIGATHGRWRELCGELLGVLPEENDLTGQRLRMQWLTDNFNHIPPYPTEEQMVQYTRAYILRLIGGWLISDKGSTYVYCMYLPFLRDLDQCRRYSWGGAVLAHLYREMCNATDSSAIEISGCLTLLHLWAWDRFPALAPPAQLVHNPLANLNIPQPPLGRRWGGVDRQFQPPGRATQYYRRYFDMCPYDDFVWQPYDNNDVQQLIPDYCMEHQHLWRSSCPLICMHIVEWHHPDRCLRQFGMDQPIPEAAIDLDFLNVHGTDLRGRTTVNWSHEHRQFLALWDLRHQRIIGVDQPARPLRRNSEYWRWYQKITRRWLDVTTGSGRYVADRLTELRETIQQHPESELSSQVDHACIEMQQALGEQLEGLLLDVRVQAPTAPRVPVPDIAPTQGRRRRRRGFLSIREPTQNIYDQPNQPSPPSQPHEQEPPRHSFYVPSSPAYDEAHRHSFHMPSTTYGEPPRHSFSGFAGPSSSYVPSYFPGPPDIPESSSRRSHVEDYTGPPPFTQETPVFDDTEGFITPSPYQMMASPRPGSFTEFLSGLNPMNENAPFQRQVQPLPLPQSLSSSSSHDHGDERDHVDTRRRGRRQPDRDRRAPDCGTGGRRGHRH